MLMDSSVAVAVTAQARPARRRLLAVLAGCCASVALASEPAELSLEAMLDLSLQELRQITVSGAAVQELAFDQIMAIASPLQQRNRQLPIAAEVVDKHTIQARGLSNVVQVMAGMTGVLAGESPSEPYSFSMRGFSRDSVKVLFDGISMGRSTLNMRPLSSFGLAQVEVLKGPTGIAHGQGAAGGTINMVLRQPQLGDQHHSEWLLSYGRFDSYSANAGFTGPLGQHSAYRLDLSRNESAGWVDDTDSDSLNINLSSLWALTPALELRYTLSYLDDDLPAYWGTPLIPRAVARKPLNDVVTTADERVVDKPTRYRNYNVADHVIESTSLWHKLGLNWQLNPDMALQASLYYFDAERDWRNAESYRYNRASGLVDRDRLLVSHDRDLWGIETALSIAGSVLSRPNQLVLRLEHSDNDFARQVGFDRDDFFVDSVDLYQPEPGRFGRVDVRDDFEQIETSALVLTNITALTPRLRAGLALRQERVAVARRQFEFDGKLRARSSLDKHFYQNGLIAGLSYQLSEGLTAYANVSDQHDTIEGSFDVVYDLANFEPSDVEQKEIGLKAALLDRRLDFSLALFDIKKTQRAQPGPAPLFQTNKQTSQGLEFNARAIIGADIRVGASYAYVDAEYGRFFDGNEGVDASGQTPVNAPEHMAGLWLSVNRVAELPLELGGSAHYVSERQANAENTVTLEEYALLNLFAATQFDHCRLAFHLRNLTDEVYAPWSDVSYPDQIILGAPRSYEFSLQLRF